MAVIDQKANSCCGDVKMVVTEGTMEVVIKEMVVVVDIKSDVKEDISNH